jgi:succinate dehydrogenase/fumarate reductase cytochrome b subunit
MKKLYHFFGPILSILLVLAVLPFIPLLLSFFSSKQPQTNCCEPPSESQRMLYSIVPLFGKYITIVLLIGFALSFMYFIYGCIRYLYLRFSHKKETKKGAVKRNILRGVTGMVIFFVIYFLLSVILAFSFGLGPQCLCLPSFKN